VWRLCVSEDDTGVCQVGRIYRVAEASNDRTRAYLHQVLQRAKVPVAGCREQLLPTEEVPFFHGLRLVDPPAVLLLHPRHRRRHLRFLPRMQICVALFLFQAMPGQVDRR
jgi:hypothetical protein